MIKVNTVKNVEVNVPENISEDSSERFNITNIDAAIKYYIKNGYVIFSNYVSANKCDLIRDSWNNSIKKYNGKIYRQTTGKAEKNYLNDNDWVMNPVLNIQSLNFKNFGYFRDLIDKEIFNNKKICLFLKKLFNDKPKIIQSMYFEGNSATGEHQDTYYLDSEEIGTLTAGWVALEEIKADAGRFFIFEGSHTVDITKLENYEKILSNHDHYVDELISLCKKNNFKPKAPFLNKGDVLFWNSKTLHGSLNSQSKLYSRSSITFHAIPNNHKFLHWHKHYLETPTDNLGESFIYRRKDQKLLKNRIIFNLETSFPNLFYFIKKNVVKYIFKQKHY